MYSKELLKGTLKPIILSLLTENKKMYGYEITQEVKKRSEGKILLKEGSLYPTLHSLKKEGLLETSEVKIGNRIRKYYSLTSEGNAKVKASVKEVFDFMKTLNSVFNPQLSFSQ
ncbi:MAG: PadR family transcriptional regulator [Bacteroidia bacterium]